METSIFWVKIGISGLKSDIRLKYQYPICCNYPTISLMCIDVMFLRRALNVSITMECCMNVIVDMGTPLYIRPGTCHFRVSVHVSS